VNETLQKFYAESDPAKKEVLLAEIISKSETQAHKPNLR
jgi:hypothetical protein